MDNKENSFTTSFLVDRSPEEVFKAINNVGGWWLGEVEGVTDKLGGEFVYRYKNVHFSKQKIVTFIPGKEVVWQVTESKLSSFKNETEWTGTTMIFLISKKGDKTELSFTHSGLVPSFVCYGDCSGAWSFLINNSLYKLITTGKGAVTFGASWAKR